MSVDKLSSAKVWLLHCAVQGLNPFLPLFKDGFDVIYIIPKEKIMRDSFDENGDYIGSELWGPDAWLTL